MAKWRERKKADYPDDTHKQLLAAVQELKKDNEKEYKRMDRALKLYEGKMWNLADSEFVSHNRPEGRSDAQFNTVFANIEQIAPLITASRPIASVVPEFPFFERPAIALNHVLKYAWEALDLQRIVYKAVKDQMIFGIAIFKVGWDPDKGNVDVSLIDPRCFALAPGYDDAWDAPFYCTWARKPLSWVHRQFPDIEEIEPDAGGEDSGAYKFGDVSDVQSHTKFVTVYEFWARDDEAFEEVVSQSENGEEKREKKQKYPYGKICYFTEKQFLGTEEFGDSHGKPPIVEMHDYIRPHNFLGMSEIDQTEGLHREINRLLKYVSEYIRKYHDPNFLADMSQLEDSTIEALKERMADGGQIIPWDSTGNRSPPLIQVNEGELNDLILPYMSFLMNILDIVSGVTDVKRGVVGKKERQSASELAMLNEAADTRLLLRIANLEWSLKRLFWMLLMNVQQYYEEPRPISYPEDGKRVYSSYGNSFAQMNETMQPSQLGPQAQDAVDNGKPLSKPNAEEVNRVEQEMQDYKDFLEFFKNENGELPDEYDPVRFGFSIEIQSNSTLPTDKQSRANLFLRLRQLKSIDVLSLLKELQVPNAEEIVKRLQEEAGGGKEQMMEKLKSIVAQKQGAPARGGQE